jgi:aminopeptidase YwaD
LDKSYLARQAETYLRQLCLEFPSRRVGTEGNRAATDLFAAIVASFGFETETPTFACIDWEQDGAQLNAGGVPFETHVSPYSLGCEVRGPLVVASDLDTLEAVDGEGAILFLHGEIAKEQLMPKNFPFYNPDAHKRIIRALEQCNPLALIAATTRDPEMAGAVYPFPLIEDGDFDIPSVYMIEDEGMKLAEHVGDAAHLRIDAQREPSQGCNVVAFKGADRDRRVVLFAHIDAKDGTPGALDNAAGVAVLLLLAELLSDYNGGFGVEIVALNGEDYYDAPGEKLWLQQNDGRFAEITLGINLDGAGYVHGDTAYSTYDCPSDLSGAIQRAFSAREGMIEGEPWYQGDHGLFLLNGVPALAITSERFMHILAEIAHTPEDIPDLVNPSKLVEIAYALHELLLALNRNPS